MKKLFKVFLWAFLSIAGLAAAATGLSWYLLSASVPDYDEDFSVWGLERPVEIVRDASAVPHISAESSADIYFALGFVHAQDRLGQMLRARQAGNAMSAAPQSLELAPNVARALEAYANGVNAWIEEVAKGGRGRGAPELLLLERTIRQWRSSDSLAIVQAFLASLRPQDKAADPHRSGAEIIPDDRPESPELFLDRPDARLNAWDLPADRTVSDAPIIATDVTGSLSLPSQWYLADIQLPSGAVIGATLPGVPFIIIGQSESVAWSFRSAAWLALDDAVTRAEIGAEGFLTALSRLERSSGAEIAAKAVAGLLPQGLQVVTADGEALASWPEDVSGKAPYAEAPDFRGLRRTILDERQSIFSVDGVIAAQQDSVSAAARFLLPLMAKELWFKEDPLETEPKPASHVRSDIVNRLARWNGEMDRQSADPLVFWAWVRALQRRVLEDEFPGMENLWARSDPAFLYNVLTDRDGRSIWCDIRQSGRIETCDEMIRAALDDALEWLVERHGPDPAEWYWGSEHSVVMEWSATDPGGVIADIAGIVEPVSGGPYTQKSTQFSLRDAGPFDSRYGTNFQAVMSLADDEHSYFIAPAGQSAHPLSGFYDNLFPMWMLGDYLIMNTDNSIAGSAAAGTSRLSPLS